MTLLFDQKTIHAEKALERCLCGTCAKKVYSNLSSSESLEMRKKHALSLEWYHVYVCNECGIHFYLSRTGFVKSYEVRFIQALADSDLEKIGVTDILYFNG